MSFQGYFSRTRSVYSIYLQICFIKISSCSSEQIMWYCIKRWIKPNMYFRFDHTLFLFITRIIMSFLTSSSIIPALILDRDVLCCQAFAMDERTTLLVYKLVNAEILEGVTGIISTGKEAAVLHAVGGW